MGSLRRFHSRLLVPPRKRLQTNSRTFTSSQYQLYDSCTAPVSNALKVPWRPPEVWFALFFWEGIPSRVFPRVSPLLELRLDSLGISGSRPSLWFHMTPLKQQQRKKNGTVESWTTCVTPAAFLWIFQRMFESSTCNELRSSTIMNAARRSRREAYRGARGFCLRITMWRCFRV